MPLTISPAPEIGIVIFKGQSLPALVRLPHLAADEDTQGPKPDYMGGTLHSPPGTGTEF